MSNKGIKQLQGFAVTHPPLPPPDMTRPRKAQRIKYKGWVHMKATNE